MLNRQCHDKIVNLKKLRKMHTHRKYCLSLSLAVSHKLLCLCLSLTSLTVSLSLCLCLSLSLSLSSVLVSLSHDSIFLCLSLSDPFSSVSVSLYPSRHLPLSFLSFYVHNDGYERNTRTFFSWDIGLKSRVNTYVW